MNRVGHAGRGESTWLGFFLHGVLTDFAALCDARTTRARAERYRAEAAPPRRRSSSWRGTANGIAAGTTTTARRSARRRTTSARSIRSRSRGRCSPARCRSASPSARWMRSAHGAHRARDRSCCCCSIRRSIGPRRIPDTSRAIRRASARTAGSTRTPRPGSSWRWPPRQRRRGGRAVPHAQSDQPHADARRRRALQAEPYVIAGDVYARAPHAGRGGWSWYTGSAAWMYRAGLESMLGLRRRGADVQHRSLHPVVVAGVQITWRHRGTRYVIQVSNPDGECRGVVSASLDGVEVDHRAIPLVDDAGTHELLVTLGGVQK